MNISIGYDTSCYTTSIAAVDENGREILSYNRLLPVNLGDKGLRQSEAVFKHLIQINEISSKLFDFINDNELNIVSVAASKSPRNLNDSYMPVFLVGKTFAQHIANLLKCKLYYTSHQMGHIYSAKYNNTINSNKILCLHISGGTTELLIYNQENYSLDIVGKTLDISTGQLIDRLGVQFGYPFPAGKYIEELALQVNDISNLDIRTYALNDKLNCSFSGLETKTKSMIYGYNKNQISRMVFECIAKTMSDMIVSACTKYDLDQVLIFGGVASSNLIRNSIKKFVAKKKETIKLYFGENKFSSDNALGIALYAMEMYKNER